MRKSALGPFLLAGVLAAMPAAVGASDDERKIVVLDKTERALLLEQMRTMLEGLQQILEGLGEENMEAIAAAAGPLASPLAEKIPTETMERLPMEFQQLANSLPLDFQRIALDAETAGDERRTAAQLSSAMAKCLACHRSYQVKVE